MATSGSVDFNLTKQSIIQEAYELINVYGAGDTIEDADYQKASRALNMMVKAWQAEGFRLWKRKEATLFTAYRTKTYSLSSTGDHCTNSYVDTTLSAAAILGATSLTVVSTTGMTANDNIGIKLSDSTRFWTTISSVDSSTTITLASGLSAAASSGATVVAYTTKINRPLEIFDKTCRYKKLSEDYEIPIQQMRYEDYMFITSKDSDGAPILFNYNPELTLGKFRLYLRPDDVDYIINFSYSDPLEDFDSDANDPDFPQEWTLALIYNLAVHLCYPHGRYQELERIEPKAQELKLICKEFDNEQTSLLIAPDFGPNSKRVD
jgi:hypothetical protein